MNLPSFRLALPRLTKKHSCGCMSFVLSLNFSVFEAGTYKGLATLIVTMTCITEGHPSTCVNKAVIYHFTFYLASVQSQLEFFPATLDPT